MLFEDDDSYDKSSEFQAAIDEIVFRQRGSVMRTESMREIKQWSREHATSDETSYYTSLEPKIVKKDRLVPTLKRMFGGVEIKELGNFGDDRLDVQRTCLFTEDILPKRNDDWAEGILGFTTTELGFAFGTENDLFPPPADKHMREFVKALIGVARRICHAFSKIETKGAEGSIEEAENQALRTGTTLINDFRQVVKAARIPSQEKEKAGIDNRTFAFTCSWAPRMVKIHIALA